MKFDLFLNVDEIYDAISEAEGEGADELQICLTVEVDKNKKAKIIKIDLLGEITSQYCINIK